MRLVQKDRHKLQENGFGICTLNFNHFDSIPSISWMKPDKSTIKQMMMVIISKLMIIIISPLLFVLFS